MSRSGPIRTIAKLAYAKSLAVQGAVPSPRDAQESRSGAPDPDRVLLIGNGATHGWGTMTHELALTGQLARSLTRRTSRATDVVYVGGETMSVATVVPWLGDRPLHAYDLLLLVLSMNDAVRLTPVDEYRASLERVLDKLTAEARPAARIVVTGIHDVDATARYRGVVARLGQRNADRLNAAMRELVGRYEGVEFLELSAPRPEPTRPHGSPAMYEAMSEEFATACAPSLDAVRRAETERGEAPDDRHRWSWEPGRRILEETPEEHLEGLERVVAEAKDRFGVDVAYVTLVDGDRQFIAANTAPVRGDNPLELANCRVTIQGDEPVIIENSLRDERFANPYMDLMQMRFYAGVPLKDADGRNVGTFCMGAAMPGRPRALGETDLLAYAARAQEELQRLAAATERPAPAEHPLDASAP